MTEYERWKAAEEKAGNELRDLGMTGHALSSWYARRVEELFKKFNEN